jgi:hypothetical protein
LPSFTSWSSVETTSSTGVEASKACSWKISIWSEPLQRSIHRADQAGARRAPVVRPVAGRQAGLGGDQHVLAPPLDRLAEHLFRSAGRIDVGGIEEVDAGFQADIDKAAGLFDIGRAPVAEQRAGATERAGSEA